MSSWSVSTNRSSLADGTIVTPEWTINHTQGDTTYAQGNQQYVFAPGLSGFVNTGLNIGNTIYDYNIQAYVLSPSVNINGVPLPSSQVPPYLIHLDSPARRSAYRCYTNITPSQLPSGNIIAFSQTSYRAIDYGFGGGTQIGTTQNTQPGGYIYFDNTPSGDVSQVPAGGTVNSPLQIGDSGTMYGDQTLAANSAYIAAQIGTATPTTAPGVYSNFYSAFYLSISPQVPTGTYKFRFEMDYVYL